jgi:xylulose-5-phosphate/fructose-6-phosphate phosphoketolase
LRATARPKSCAVEVESTRVVGEFLREVMRNSAGSRNFHVFSPDENDSNRLNAMLEVAGPAWNAEVLPYDDALSPDGCVMEILSGHMSHGGLQGYLLTGRHGLLSCYEAFIHIVDSMVNQHAK